MRKVLMSSVSYAVMNLALALDFQAKTRQTDEFKKFSENQTKLRYKKIFSDRPYQSVFS